jgi:hypothetical protein
MSYNSDTLWRLYNIGGADLALRYADLSAKSDNERQQAAKGTCNLEILNIHFYEGEKTYSGPATPVFASRFRRSSTRFVMYWADLRHPWRYASFQYKLLARYLRADGSPIGETEYQIEADPDCQSFWHSSGRGWEQPGKWQAGDYRVELLIDGVEAKSGAFTIFDDRPRIRLTR